MFQTTFLDDDSDQSWGPTYNRLPARHSDPITSHLAAAEVPLGVLQTEALRRACELCAVHGDCTAGEIGHASDRNHESVRKRVTELVRKGRLVATGQRACRITGKQAVSYTVKHN
jgi:hypothetical protein